MTAPVGKDDVTAVMIELQCHQALATAVLSFGINLGVKRASDTLQKGCSALGYIVNEDDDIGPGTLVAVNSITPTLCSPSIPPWRTTSIGHSLS